MTISPSPRPGHKSRRHQKTSLGLLLRNNPPLTLVLLMALAVPLLPGPRPALPWDGASGAAFEAGGVLLLALALWRADGPGVRRALAFVRRGPTPWLLGLGVWGALTAALASGGNAALQGLLHLGTGLLVYATVVYRVRRDADFRLLLDVLTAVTLLLSLLGVGSLLATGHMDAGALTHRSFGALLMLLLPLVLLSAGTPGTPAQRGARWAAVALGGVALLLAHWPPAGRGAVIALLVLGLTCWRLKVRVWPTEGVTPLARIRAARMAATAARRRAARHRHGSRSGHRSGRAAAADGHPAALNGALYAITVFCAVAVFLVLTPGGSAALRQIPPALASAVSSSPLTGASPGRLFRGVSLDRVLRGVSQGLSGAGHAETPEGRQSARALRAMIEAKPITGWGIGCYSVYQKEWTHQGDDAATVRRHGPQPADRARSAYFQMAVETGLPGLALWVAAVALFFVGVVGALRRAEEGPLRRRVLIGCLAAVAGQAVDAYSDSSWQFGGVSLFLWLVLGLGLAAGAEQSPGNVSQAGAALAQTGWRAHLRFAAVCVLSAALLAMVVYASG